MSLFELQAPGEHVTPSQHASVWVSVNVLLLFLLFLSSLLKVSPSSSLCDVHHFLSMLPAVWLLPLFHASIASLVTHHSSAYCAPLLLHPSIHPFMHQTSPINPPTGDYVMCRGAYRHPGLSRQPPSAGGFKGESHQSQMFWGSPSLSHSFFHSMSTLSLSLSTYWLNLSGFLWQWWHHTGHWLFFFYSFGALQRWGMELAVLRSCTWTMATTTTPIEASASDWDRVNLPTSLLLKSEWSLFPSSVLLIGWQTAVHDGEDIHPVAFVYIV